MKDVKKELKNQILTEFDPSSNTKTIINREEYINVATGELTTIDSVSKYTCGVKNFWKCYLMDFLTVLGIIDNKQLDIFVYIAENTNPSTNLFIGTYSKISKDLNVSRPTISTIMKKLQENNFIKKVQNGLWFVNPNILMKGNDKKRQILLTYYQADDPVEKLTVARTRQKQVELENLKNTEYIKTHEIPEARQTSILEIEGVEPNNDKNGK